MFRGSVLATITQHDDHIDDEIDNNGNDNDFELLTFYYDGDKYAQLMKIHVISHTPLYD